MFLSYNHLKNFFEPKKSLSSVFLPPIEKSIGHATN